MANYPLLIYGQVTESGTATASATVKCRNNSTNNVASATTNSNGLFLFDLSDTSLFPKGYTDGQTVTVYIIYQNFQGDITITIAIPIYGYEANITLSAVTDTYLIDYCTVQHVYDELDAKTSSDISVSRIVSAIQRAEGLIDTKAQRYFKQVTITNETHTLDRYSGEVSPDYLDTLNPNINDRHDRWLGQLINRVRVSRPPIVSVTTLQVNSAGVDAADSWTTLTEQTGSGGDFLIENTNAGIIDFVDNYPKTGKRSWRVTYVSGYNRDSTDRKILSLLRVVERLTVLLACKQIITTKSTGAMFDSTRDVKIGAIEIKAGAMSGVQYLKSIEPEIEELWKQIGGDLEVDVI